MFEVAFVREQIPSWAKWLTWVVNMQIRLETCV